MGVARPNDLGRVDETGASQGVAHAQGLAKLVFEMNQSLDGYVDHRAFAPSPTLFRHFIEEARIVEGDLEGAIRELKAERDGGVEVAGPNLAQSLTALGLIAEYRIYLRPVVLAQGQPCFAGPPAAAPPPDS